MPSSASSRTTIPHARLSHIHFMLPMLSPHGLQVFESACGLCGCFFWLFWWSAGNLQVSAVWLFFPQRTHGWPLWGQSFFSCPFCPQFLQVASCTTVLLVQWLAACPVSPTLMHVLELFMYGHALFRCFPPHLVQSHCLPPEVPPSAPFPMMQSSNSVPFRRQIEFRLSSSSASLNPSSFVPFSMPGGWRTWDRFFQ